MLRLSLLNRTPQYHIGDVELVARFAHVFKQPQPSHCTSQTSNSVRIFSGDVFSPSTEASIMRGEHMVPVLNELGIDIACYGNHGLASLFLESEPRLRQGLRFRLR